MNPENDLRRRILNRVTDMSNAPRSRELRDLENDLREYRRHVETIERREGQAEELQLPDAEPVQWFGDIGQFCADLVFHAKRLGREVRGEFNGVALVALPDGDARELERTYWPARRKEFDP